MEVTEACPKAPKSPAPQHFTEPCRNRTQLTSYPAVPGSISRATRLRHPHTVRSTAAAAEAGAVGGSGTVAGNPGSTTWALGVAGTGRTSAAHDDCSSPPVITLAWSRLGLAPNTASVPRATDTSSRVGVVGDVHPDCHVRFRSSAKPECRRERYWYGCCCCRPVQRVDAFSHDLPPHRYRVQKTSGCKEGEVGNTTSSRSARLAG